MGSDPQNYRTVIRDHLITSSNVKTECLKKNEDFILNAANLIVQSFRSGGKILICGNGGSAADAQHMAAEFTNVLRKEFNRPALPAIALTTDTSFLTAYSNDFGFEGIFKRQVQALGKKGDIFFGISSSGNSKNVINAVDYAKSASIKCIVLIGKDGALQDMADLVISVPSDNTQHIQEAHLAIEHIICTIVENQLFPQKEGESGHQ